MNLSLLLSLRIISRTGCRLLEKRITITRKKSLLFHLCHADLVEYFCKKFTSPTRLQPPHPALAPLSASGNPSSRKPERAPAQSLSQGALYDIPPQRSVAKAPMHGKGIGVSVDPLTHQFPPRASVDQSLSYTSSNLGKSLFDVRAHKAFVYRKSKRSLPS